MANEKDSGCSSLSFSDFPEDVQLCILSFLGPTEIATFACTSKRFGSLCSNDPRLWFTMCERRWGSKTDITKWGKGKIVYRLLYNTLHEWDNLIGFWRRSGPGSTVISSPSLLFFEWGPSFLSGSRVSPSNSGTYDVIKSPFLRMSLSDEGHVVNFVDPDGRAESDYLGFSENENELIPVSVGFMGKTHFAVEENRSFACHDRRRSSSANLSGEDSGTESGSPGSLPDRLMMSEIYQHLANRTSPGSDRSRKQRRREKERLGRRKWEPEHFVKIVNCSPTPSRPLQGLWKVFLNCSSFLVMFQLCSECVLLCFNIPCCFGICLLRIDVTVLGCLSHNNQPETENVKRRGKES